MKNNFRAHDSTSSDADWAGHCNNASEVAALLKEPKYAVTYNGVTFSPKEIAGLLVKVSSSLSQRVDFEGRRYNNFMDDLDGVLAAKLNIRSDFGALLDNVCDAIAHTVVVMAVGMHFAP